MRKALFQIENDPVFKGYSDGSKWNGFANPYFDLQTAKMVLAYYQNQDCEESRDQWANWDLTPSKTFEGIDLYYFGGGYIWFELTSLDILSNLLEDWSEIEGEEVASADEMLCGLKEDDKNRKYKFDWLYAFINLWNVEEERGKN
tara:strand:+ start:109 stop:543 length:435 start_codon:yes stop_codon:yes gene_type:complete